LVGHPFEGGLKATVAAMLRDAPATSIVTGLPENFSARACERLLRVARLAMNADQKALFRLLSVESFDKCAPQQQGHASIEPDFELSD
jgi:hypothetical protein